MNRSTKKAMEKHAQTLPGGSERAQSYTISSYSISSSSTIAEQLDNDHRSQDGAKRAALLMVDAGCAIHNQTEQQIKKSLFGKFTFNDGSELY